MGVGAGSWMIREEFACQDQAWETEGGGVQLRREAMLFAGGRVSEQMLLGLLFLESRSGSALPGIEKGDRGIFEVFGVACDDGHVVHQGGCRDQGVSLTFLVWNM